MTTFNSEAVQQILHRAMTHQKAGEFSEQQLKEMAAELGISAAALEIAQQEWQQDREKIQQKQVVNARRQRGFKAHLIPFVAVNIFLILLNLVTTPKYFWAIYPLLGWGVGLGIHAACTYHLKDETYSGTFVNRLN